MPDDTKRLSAEKSPALRYEKERHQFRALILSNPNYFGNIKASQLKPVLQLQGDTTYEEIGCVGFQPQFNRLEAVVYVKQPSGYGGAICSSGTPEFVRFYISLDDGATWQDQGLASFTAFDIPTDVTKKQRLEYAVTRDIKPPKKFCFASNLARVRAILSWNVPPPPNDPNFTPVWGNVHDTHVQIDPIKLLLLGDVLKELEVKIPPQLGDVLDLKEPVAAAKPKALSLAELQEAYRGKNVEPHRFALAEIKSLINQPSAAESLMASSGFESLLTTAGINLGDLIGQLFPVDGNTTYEQLECIGLDPNLDMLVGVIRVKLPNGYSGGPCTAGSREYVTFWGDFDSNGSFETCLGTTSVNVYDIQKLPKDGLEYAVFLPVDLSKYRQPCQKGAKVVRIRAIMAWQEVPPCPNPNFIPVWGNRLETLIQIKPGIKVDTQVPFLSAVGDMGEIDIAANGKCSGVAIHTGFVAADSPFGGRITIAGHVSNPTPGMKYRVMRKLNGAPDSTYAPLVNEPQGLDLLINTWDIINGWVQTHQTIHALAPISDGYYPFEDFSSVHSVEGNIVGLWNSTVAEDGLLFDLRIDLSVDGNPAHDVHSNVVTVLIDNVGPQALLDLSLGAGVQCGDFAPGAIINGQFTATDPHFGGFSFEIEPSGPPNFPSHGVLPVPASGSSAHYGGIYGDPGAINVAYTVNTGPMDPCGYAIILHVSDRTNVNSGQTSNTNQASVGFCLKHP